VILKASWQQFVWIVGFFNNIYSVYFAEQQTNSQKPYNSDCFFIIYGEKQEQICYNLFSKDGWNNYPNRPVEEGMLITLLDIGGYCVPEKDLLKCED
jgi:hypothetical protein